MEKSAFEAHPIWPALDALEAALKEAEKRDDSGATEALNTLRYLTSAIRAHDDPSDTAPYATAAMAAVQSHLPNVTQEANNYVSNGNVQHLLNAASHADSALHQLGMWPTQTLKGGAAAAANRLFVEYRDAASAAIETLRDLNAELRAALAQQETEHETAVSGLRAEIAALSAKITADESRLDTALTTNNEAFTTKQTEREDKFKAFMKEQG